MFEPQLCRSNIHHFTTNQIPKNIEVIEKFNSTKSYSQETKHLNETIPTLNYNVLRERSQELWRTPTIHWEMYASRKLFMVQKLIYTTNNLMHFEQSYHFKQADLLESP